MEEYEKKFLEFLRYAGFIKEEKEKIQRFLSGLPSFNKDKIQFDEPRTFTETIRKAKYLHEKCKGRETFQNYWKHKKKEKLDQRRKGFKPSFNRNNPNTYQQNQPGKSESKMEYFLGKMGRLPIKCCVCKEDNMYNDYPCREDKMRTLHNIQEDTSGRHGNKYYKHLCDPRRSTNKSLVSYD